MLLLKGVRVTDGAESTVMDVEDEAVEKGIGAESVTTKDTSSGEVDRVVEFALNR